MSTFFHSTGDPRIEITVRVFSDKIMDMDRRAIHNVVEAMGEQVCEMVSKEYNNGL